MRVRNNLLGILTLVVLLMAAGCGENSSADLERFTGTWAQEDYGWINGGVAMDITEGEGTLTAVCTANNPAPYGGGQAFTVTFSASDLVDDFVSVDFTGEDHGGYTGTLELQFMGERLYCEIKDLSYMDEDLATMTCFYSGTFTMVRMDDAHERMECTDEEYEAWYRETYPEFFDDEYDSGYEEAVPSNDQTKASGILAEMGMTEEEFKEACQPLCCTGSSQYFNVEELRRYPSDYVGGMYYFTFNNAIASSYGPPNAVEVKEKGMSTDGYTTYILGTNCLVFDLRDDIYYPTISVGNKVICYVIFTGVQTCNGIDFACFNLIATGEQG